MKRARLLLLILPAMLVLAASGCGGGDEESVPDNAVAVVGGTEIAKSQFDSLINQAKRSYKAQKQAFPKAGTPEYNTLKNQAMQFLVQRAEFEQRAKDLDIEVSDKQVQDRLAQIKKQYFKGSQERYDTQLKQQGLTDVQVRADIRAQLIQEAIFKEVTKDVKVTDKQIEDYYNKNKQQYGSAETREVRHILVATKKQATELYDRLKSGESFAKLAKQFSKDPGSKDMGGKLTVSRGQTVAPFDQTAFLLPTGSLSRPVKTQYGYHLIEPLAGVKPANTTPLKEVRESIRQQLLQTRRNDAMTKWVEQTKKDFEKQVAYQVGFAPPSTGSGTGTSTN